MAVGLMVGLLMLAGCGSESSQTGATGQVLLQAPAADFKAEGLPVECTTQNSSTTLVLSATLDIEGVLSGIPMTVNPDCSVMARVPNVPVGTWTFRITYRAGSGDDRLVIAEASGVGTVTANTTTTVPLTSTKLSSPATAVATGRDHSCARLADGTVKCWGANESGQLGDGATRPFERRPVVLEDFPNVAAIATGENHTCAILTNDPSTLESTRTMWCWGANESGQLGNGRSGDPSPTPVSVRTSDTDSSPLTGVDAIATGSRHTCAIQKVNASDIGGTVWCWGNNGLGQLGRGPTSTTDRTRAEQVTGLSSPAIAIAGGGPTFPFLDGHSCASLKDGTVWCWGANERGQLGNGSREGRASHSPEQVLTSLDPRTALTNAIAIAAGWDHSCASLKDGTVWCWGANESGQLGTGRRVESPLAVKVVDIP
jgi:alpha-tubulin suppressor-like RCC1 family protein